MQNEIELHRDPQIEVVDVSIAYDDNVILRDINFAVHPGEIFIVMGGSGCGKTSLLQAIVGLDKPLLGDVYYSGINFWHAERFIQEEIMKRTSVLFQNGALWSSMTLAENVALPLRQFTELTAKQVAEVVALKMSLVGLSGYEDYYPSELSGGMIKRAALARAMALDPEILFFDEHTAGLDPMSAAMLDNLIVEMRNSFGMTAVIVTHDIASIMAIGDNAIFLDDETQTIIARGSPKELLAGSEQPKVRDFLTRGGELQIGALKS